MRLPSHSLTARNITWLFLGQSAVKAIAFFYTIFLARVLGVFDFGFYVFVLTSFTLISSLSDLGFNRYLVRDLARDRRRISKYLSNVLLLKVILNALLIVLVTTGLLIADRNILWTLLVILGLLSIFPSGVALTFDAVFTALEKMHVSALTAVTLNLSIALLGLVFIMFFNFSVAGAVIALFVGHLVYLATSLFFITRLGFLPRFSFDFRFWRKSITSSLPYGILAVLGLIYLRIDAVMLTFLKGEESTGLYGAAFKFLDGVHFIPVVVVTALYPVMSRIQQTSIRKLKSFYQKAVGGLLIISVVIALLLFFLAPVLIKVFYGESYLPSVLSLRILSVTAIFTFIHIPSVYLLFANEKFLPEAIFLSLFGVILNVVLNLLLIPPFDLYGASISTVIAEAVSAILFFCLIWFKIFRPAK